MKGVTIMDGYKHILVPIDGSECSECSERAVTEAVRLKEAFQSKMTLLYIVSDPDFDCAMGNPAVINASVKKECGEAEKYLQRRVESLPEGVETKVVVGCIAKSILQEAEDLGCDLIVMGSQGLGSALRRFFVGSVAKNVLANAEIPVLIAH